MARNKVRRMIYNAKILAISHLYAEKGERKLKGEIIGENLAESVEPADYMAIVPKWCVGKKDAWKALVDLWVGNDENFKAKSIQNKANRGREGTHNQGNRDFFRYKEHKVAANGGQNIPDLQVWQMAHKKKEAKADKDPYYGTTSVDLMEYSHRYKGLHGQDTEPLEEPLDETAVMISGEGRRHGRLRVLDAVVKSTTTLTRIRATTGATVSIPPRAPRGGSTRTHDDVRWEEAYEQVYHDYMEKMKEWQMATQAYDSHIVATNKAIYSAMRNGTPLPEFADPPEKPPMPTLPTRAEFLAAAAAATATGTPGSVHSQVFLRRSSASPHESPMATPLHVGGPSPGVSTSPSRAPHHESRDSRRNSPIQ